MSADNPTYGEAIEAIEKENIALHGRIAALEQFMERIAKELGCLPSFSDPANGNEHIFRALSALRTRDEDANDRFYIEEFGGSWVVRAKSTKDVACLRPDKSSAIAAMNILNGRTYEAGDLR